MQQPEIGPTALIADDDEFFSIAAERILLTELGFARVLHESSLERAVGALTSTPNIAIVLVDRSLDGMVFSQDLRLLRRSASPLRLAVVSRTCTKQDVLEALAAGAHAYIPKSAGAMGLTHAVKQVLAGEIYVPPLVAEPELGLDRRASATSPAPREPSWASLTPRQQEVLTLIVEGRSNKEIARSLGLGEGTVKVHVAALFRSLNLTSRSAAAAVGARLLAEGRRAEIDLINSPLTTQGSMQNPLSVPAAA